jgi:glycosyltransferase involved in cell wall biosynthesis
MPVYNGEKYLKEAIDSWLKQSIEEKELICIDDGSTDNSSVILDDYAKKYSNIRIFHQDNKGAGPARNLGINVADGECLTFLDADDFYIDSFALEKMYQYLKSSDLQVVAGFLQMFEGGKLHKDTVLRDLYESKGIGQKSIKYVDFQFDYNYQCYLIKKSLLLDNGICFPDLRRFQDPPFLVKTLYSAGEFGILPVEVYGYRIGQNSGKYFEKAVNDLYEGLLSNLIFAKKHNLDKLAELTRNRMQKDFIYTFFDSIHSGNLSLRKRMEETQRLNCIPIELFDVIPELADAGTVFEWIDVYHAIQAKVDRNSDIIMYGAGKIGSICYQCVTAMHLANVVDWIDLKKCGCTLYGRTVKDWESVQPGENVIVLIAVHSEDMALEMRDVAMRNGISENRIVYL